MGKPFGIPGFYWVTLGGVGVTLFIILSGLSLELNRRSNENYGRFILNRVLRIYPVYYMSLILAVAIYIGSKGFKGLDYSDIFWSITGLYSLAGKWGGPFIVTSWFIGTIMVLYLLYPFMSQWIRSRPVLTILLLLLVSVACRIVLGQGIITLPERAIDWFPLCRVFEFGLGIFLAHLNWGTIYSPKPLVFMAELTYPLFLIHHPFIFLVAGIKAMGVPVYIAIVVFLIVSIVLSIVVLFLDKRFQAFIRQHFPQSVS